jgi:hypothetical protein
MAAASQPSPVDNAQEAARSATASVNVALPGSIVSYDRTTQTATVRIAPCRRRRDPAQGGAVVCYRPPDLPGVPVAFMGGGDYSDTWPLAEGDTGLIIFCDRSIVEWKATGASETEPQDPRRHDVSDAIFIPGLRPTVDPVPSAGIHATARVIRAGLLKLGSSAASDKVALNSLVRSEINRIWTVLTTWTVSPGDGGAALKAAALLAVGAGAGSVGAAKVEAE